jgi:hypothetical protein
VPNDDTHAVWLDGDPIGESVKLRCRCGWSVDLPLWGIDSAEKLQAAIDTAADAHRKSVSHLTR